MTLIEMRQRLQPVILCSILVFLLLLTPSSFSSASAQESRVAASSFNLVLDPSSVVIKVGDKGTINLTVVNSGASVGKLCYGQEGFPDSGFILTFLPQCGTLTVGSLRASLTVEATGAAAPQNFTATILAIAGNTTAHAPLTVTVVPGIPVWVPWVIIIVFILFLGIAVVVKPSKVLRRKSAYDPTQR